MNDEYWTPSETVTKYCGSGNIREVLNFARRANSRIKKSRKNYYYISVTKGKYKIWNSRKFKHAKITRSLENQSSIK